MPTIEINGASIYHEEQGKGFPVIFVHGAGGNHMSWWQQVPEFSRHYRTVTYDQRGWGLSLDADGAGPSALVRDLEALLNHLGIEETFLVAQSMGSLACVGLTLVNPARVKGLVLANTFAGMRREVWLASSDDVRGRSPRVERSWDQPLMSAPAQKPRPPPVTIRTRTSGSRLASSTAAVHSSSMLGMKAFIAWGRFSVMIPIWSSTL